MVQLDNFTSTAQRRPDGAVWLTWEELAPPGKCIESLVSHSFHDMFDFMNGVCVYVCHECQAEMNFRQSLSLFGTH